MDGTTPIELGAWLGRSEACGLIRDKCSAVHAECLKQIREGQLYTAVGLTWEEFCRRHLGISRAYADKLIHRLNEFGANYFRLSELMRINPEIYRALEPSIDGEQIEIDGELVPINQENGPRIRAAIKAVRAELARVKELQPTCASITDLQFRFDGCFSVMRRLHHGTTDSLILASLSGLIGYCMTNLKEIANQIENKR